MLSNATSLGSALREERLQKKLDLAGIARQTRICIAILEAIERDRFDCIPGGAYRRHFLRQYACALGMDDDAVIAEFKKQYEEPPVPLPIPPKTRRSSLWADLVWAVMVIASLAATYELVQNRRAASKHQDVSAAQIAPLLRSAQRESPDPVEPPPTPAIAAEPPTPSVSAASSVTASVHVAFTAIEPVWVSVKCDGNASFAGLLQVPESRTFDASGAVTALIGNAAGVQISLNGKPVAPLGAHGEVEMIELTPQGARRIERRPQAPGESTIPQQ